MDRRTVLAVVLSLGIYYAWLALRPPPPEPAEEPAPATEAPAPATAPVPAAAAPGPAGPAAEAPPIRSIPFEMCGTTGELSTDGGRLHGLTIDGHTGSLEVTPLYRWVIGKVTGSAAPGPWVPYAETGPAVAISAAGAGLITGAGPIDQVVPMTVRSESPARVELVGTTDTGVEITKVFAERPLDGACAIDVSVRWTNRGAAPFAGETWIAVREHVAEQTSSYESERQPKALVDDDVTAGGSEGASCVPGASGTRLSEDQPLLVLPGPVEWFGVADRYFGFYAVPADPAAGAVRLEQVGEGDAAVAGSTWAASAPLAPGESRAQDFVVYVGPNQAPVMDRVDDDLSRAINLGFWSAFGYPLLWLLRLFHGWVGNWGVAIILLTFTVKLVFFPLTQKSFVAAQKMQAIQPDLQKIKAEYADNPTEMNRRTMELMSERQVNPLSGCLPMFAQMPVWLALNQVILTSVDLYHTRFLYLKDLSAADPTMILPLAITALMWLQQKLSSTANLDPAQQQVMRFMPLIFGLMFFAFPSGLAVYVFVNMVLSILQQWWIKRRFGGPGGLPAALPLG